ncbi:MAG: serine dehydratase [Peptococcaceae bacterium]
MDKIYRTARENHLQMGHLTLGDCIKIADEAATSVSEVIIAEAMHVNKMDKNEVCSAVIASFSHNLYATELGVTSGSSFLFGNIGRELTGIGAPKIIADHFLNKVLVYTLATQIGNHSIGLQPCAGTGDSCPYTGFMKALIEDYEDQDKIAHVAAVVLKIGTMFRAGKTTTGCNMEGFGAGAAALAAGFTELAGGKPAEIGKAVVLALSPTIANPCTPRVMVAGLCATHIGGAVMIAKLASQLAMHTTIPVTVPVDVMVAMAAAVHPVSAKAIVPMVIKYMEPFFKTNYAVENYVDLSVKESEEERKHEIIHKALEEARGLAEKANSIVKPFGAVVVGGSSQAVGSPTNAARIVHFLAKGEITKVTIELYPELFARRGINVPGILMAAVFGAATDDGIAYKEVMDKIKQKNISVQILQTEESQMQRITLQTAEGIFAIETLNRGGGRLVLKKAYPSLEAAREIANKLSIEAVEEE